MIFCHHHQPTLKNKNKPKFWSPVIEYLKLPSGWRHQSTYDSMGPSFGILKLTREHLGLVICTNMPPAGVTALSQKSLILACLQCLLFCNRLNPHWSTLFLLPSPTPPSPPCIAFPWKHHCFFQRARKWWWQKLKGPFHSSWFWNWGLDWEVWSRRWKRKEPG